MQIKKISDFQFQSKVEAYTTAGWVRKSPLPPMATGLYNTCLLTFDSTNALLIGGTTMFEVILNNNMMQCNTECVMGFTLTKRNKPAPSLEAAGAIVEIGLILKPK